MGNLFDPAIHYCPIRRKLEDRSFDLTGRLMLLTERLMQCTGRNHEAFLTTKAKCVEVRTVIADAYEELRQHRLEHRC